MGSVYNAQDIQDLSRREYILFYTSCNIIHFHSWRIPNSYKELTNLLVVQKRNDYSSKMLIMLSMLLLLYITTGRSDCMLDVALKYKK